MRYFFAFATKVAARQILHNDPTLALTWLFH
jgi:hypothetical protein